MLVYLAAMNRAGRIATAWRNVFLGSLWDFVKYATTMSSKMIPIEYDADYYFYKNSKKKTKEEDDYYKGAEYSTVAPSVNTMTTVAAYLALFNMSIATC